MREGLNYSSMDNDTRDRHESFSYPTQQDVVSYLARIDETFTDPESFEVRNSDSPDTEEMTLIVRLGLDEDHYVYKKHATGGKLATLDLIQYDSTGQAVKSKQLAFLTPDGWLRV